MTDPYEVLGVSRNASDSEIKRAYHELVKKYHPDNYTNNPLADLASEKMKEINEAYDTIVKSRSTGSGSYQQSTANSGPTGGSAYGGSSYGGSAQYGNIRSYINANQLDYADNLLNSMANHDAEWYYLKGQISYRRGWLDQARSYFQNACNLAPGNYEYQSALSTVRGGYTPYRATNYQSSDMDAACSICNTLLCLNCLCSGCR